MRLDAHFDMLPDRAFQKRGFGGAPATLEGGKGGGGGSSPAPDPNIGLAAKQQADLAQQEYEDFKANVWPQLQESIKSQTDMSTKIQQQQYDLTNKNASLADDYQKRMKEEFYPLQDKLVKQAEDTNTQGYQEQQAALAMGDINDQFANQRKQNDMRMQSYGINPTSGAYAGQQNATDIMQAATGAAAATRARQAADQLGWARMMDAQGLGAGLAGNQATSTGLSLNAGNASLASGAQGIGAVNALGNSYAQGYGGAMQGWNNVGNLGLGTYNAQISAYNAQQAANAQSSSGFGGAIGGLIGAGMNGGSGGFAKSAIGMALL